MTNKRFFPRTLIFSIVLLLAGQQLAAKEYFHAADKADLCLFDHSSRIPVFAMACWSEDPTDLGAQSGVFKSAFARRVYKSKIYRSQVQRFSMRSENLISGSGLRAPDLMHFFRNSFLRPYYYTFLFRLTPF